MSHFYRNWSSFNVLFGVLVDGIGVFEIMNQVVAWLTIALSLGEGWVLWGLGGKKVEDSRNAYIHLRLNQFSITAHNIFTYFPMPKKGRGFQKCTHTSKIKSIFKHSTQHFHIWSDTTKKAEDSENACTYISDLVKFTIQYFHIFSPKSLDPGEMFKP